MAQPRLRPDLFDLLDVRPGESVLDVGCGTGNTTARLAAAGAIVVGIDRSTVLVEQARAAHPGIEFIDIDLLELDDRELFDAIFSLGTLHWIRPPERAARILFDALRPGGRLAVELGGKSALSALLSEAGEALDGTPEMPYDPAPGSYATLLEGAGFEVLSAARAGDGGPVRVLARRPA
jgi:trans-aconitate methyltransferase